MARRLSTWIWYFIKLIIGIEKTSDNCSYEGEFIKGKKSGYGMFRWPDKSFYEGQWFNNCLHGFGKYYFPSGKYYIGEWNSNFMHGYGELSLNEGKKYFGNYYFMKATLKQIKKTDSEFITGKTQRSV